MIWRYGPVPSGSLMSAPRRTVRTVSGNGGPDGFQRSVYFQEDTKQLPVSRKVNLRGQAPDFAPVRLVTTFCPYPEPGPDWSIAVAMQPIGKVVDVIGGGTMDSSFWIAPRAIGAKPRARGYRVLPNARDQVNNANKMLGLAPIRLGAGVL